MRTEKIEATFDCRDGIFQFNSLRVQNCNYLGDKHVINYYDSRYGKKTIVENAIVSF